MKIFRLLAGIFEALTVIGAALAVLILFLSLAPPSSAVQQAAGAAIALAVVVIPYCVAAVCHRASMRAMIDLSQRHG